MHAPDSTLPPAIVTICVLYVVCASNPHVGRGSFPFFAFVLISKLLTGPTFAPPLTSFVTIWGPGPLLQTPLVPLLLPSTLAFSAYPQISLVFKNPASGVPTTTRHLMDLASTTVCFHQVCFLLSPRHHPPAHSCSTPSTSLLS
jgi:hypothetical protein